MAQDEDYQLALRLQAEEQNSVEAQRKRDEDFAKSLVSEEEKRRKVATTYKCQLCTAETELDALYILDVCIAMMESV